MEHLEKIKYLVIHHSKNRNSLESIKELHVNINNWEDIGYHWLIDGEGTLLKGRDEKFQGAHVFSFNKNSIGICLIGNFDIKRPSKNQILTLQWLLQKKMREYLIPAENILGHREFPDVKKSCPGKFVNMDEIRKLVKNN